MKEIDYIKKYGSILRSVYGIINYHIGKALEERNIEACADDICSVLNFYTKVSLNNVVDTLTPFWNTKISREQAERVAYLIAGNIFSLKTAPAVPCYALGQFTDEKAYFSIIQVHREMDGKQHAALRILTGSHAGETLKWYAKKTTGFYWLAKQMGMSKRRKLKYCGWHTLIGMIGLAKIDNDHKYEVYNNQTTTDYNWEQLKICYNLGQSKELSHQDCSTPQQETSQIAGQELCTQH